MGERVDRLGAPPVVGKYYLVPVLTARWHGWKDVWPVIGPAHTDVDFFDFKPEHCHLDGRFLTKKQIKHAESYAISRSLAAELQGAPLHEVQGRLPRPILAKRRCWTSSIPYDHGDKLPIKEIRAHYAGQQCESGKGGWICPHRKASLGSVLVEDGVIVCPLHGLKIDAASGVVLDPSTLTVGK